MKHRNSTAFVEGIFFRMRRCSEIPVIRRKRPVYDINLLLPVEITGVWWTDWNEPDIIKYKSSSGAEYLVQDENLLRDITQFMYENGLRGDIPYIHIMGKDGWECCPKPLNHHVLLYLCTNFRYFDIYTCKGELIREADK